MSYPQVIEPEEKYPEDENLSGWAERVMEKIIPAIPKPALKSNMFAARSEKYPV